jgi:hypothetical protein
MEPKFKDKAEYLEWLNTDEYKTIGQPVFDSKVSAAIKTYSLKHPTKDNLGERLDLIDKALEKKDLELKQNELKFFAFRKCTENNIDYDLLNGFPLEDEKAIADKIDQLSITQSKLNDRLVNEKLATMMQRPQSGQQREMNNNDYLLQAEERDRKSRPVGVLQIPGVKNNG